MLSPARAVFDANQFLTLADVVPQMEGIDPDSLDSRRLLIRSSLEVGIEIHLVRSSRCTNMKTFSTWTPMSSIALARR